MCNYQTFIAIQFYIYPEFLRFYASYIYFLPRLYRIFRRQKYCSFRHPQNFPRFFHYPRLPNLPIFLPAFFIALRAIGYRTFSRSRSVFTCCFCRKMSIHVLFLRSFFLVGFPDFSSENIQLLYNILDIFCHKIHSLFTRKVAIIII